jgi:hypothetical protein
LKTPVAFFIFNRPETTKRVFEEIRRSRPPMLLIVADGPRLDHPGESDKVAAARAVVEDVDWHCKVMKNYSNINLGCKVRISNGLDWVFQNVEEAIILEDDCLPHHTFFRFCEELLETYKDDDRIMHICGDNFQFGAGEQGESSYYFSRYAHVWGWASWRRAWKYYDVQMRDWGSTKDHGKILRNFADRSEKRFWNAKWNDVFKGRIDTWDFQWMYSCISRNALAIVPAVNLVSNIGFGPSSTHTARVSLMADIPTASINFPLVPPRLLERKVEADENVGNLFFRPNVIRFVAGQVLRWANSVYGGLM